MTQDFVDGGWWNRTLPGVFGDLTLVPNVTHDSILWPARANLTSEPSQVYSLNEISDIVLGMQTKVSTLQELSNDDCQAIYGSANLRFLYINLLVVIHYHTEGTFIDGKYHLPGWGNAQLGTFNPKTVYPISDTVDDPERTREPMF